MFELLYQQKIDSKLKFIKNRFESTKNVNIGFIKTTHNLPIEIQNQLIPFINQNIDDLFDNIEKILLSDLEN